MMKRTFTLLSLAVMLLVSASLLAQIPQDSPFPVDALIIGDDGSETSYSYVSTSDFGDTLSETVTAEIAWAHDDGMYDGDGDGMPDAEYGDSLACSWGTVADLTGKIALIRRGACFFSQKIYNAQQAGAIGVIIINSPTGADLGGMAGADSAHVATIPAIFFSYADGLQIEARMAAGETLSASFKVSFAFDAFGPLAYGTPATQATPLDFIEFQVFNPSPDTDAFDVTATATISEPGGGSTVLEASLDTIPALSGRIFEFDTYTPGAGAGDYSITYENSLNSDVLTRNFTLTDYTFQADNGQIVPNINGTIEPSDAGFVEDGLTYHAGIFYQTGGDGGAATHVSFMIGNPEEIYTGDADADQFVILVYDTDADDDGVVDLAGGDNTLDGLTVAGFATYTITEDHQPFDLITVELDDPVTLKPNHQYMVMVQYNGVNAGIGIPPKYAFAGNDTYIYTLAEGATAGGDIVFTDQLYSGGWTGADYNYVIRMHMDGFDPDVNIEEVGALDASKISLAPNPVSERLELTFDLTDVADEVQVGIMDFSGKLIRAEKFENVKDNTFNFNVKDLPAGPYFLSIYTPEGFRSKKFVVTK